MANEFKHKTKGGELSQAEYEHIDAHQFDGQAAGDTMYASSPTQLSRLAKASNGDVLTLAAGIPSWATPAPVTKEFFAGWGYTDGSAGFEYGLAHASVANTKYVVCNFFVPHDFTAITDAVIVLISNSSEGAANIDISSSYGAAGEAKDTHTESDSDSTYVLTLDQFYELDVSGILTGIAVGDYVGVKLLNSETNVLAVFGLRFKYT